MSNELVVLEHALAPLTDKFTQVLSVPGVNLTAPRLIRSVLISCERTPKLLNCTRQSLFNAAMSAACLGLEVDGVTGQAFLIPFDVKGTPTAQLVVGYKGYNTLGARSGLTITGEVVRQDDDFDFDEGEGWVKHRKLLGTPDRRIIAVWAKAAALDRPPVVKVLDIADVLAIQNKSPGARRSDSPWRDPAIGFPAMAEKSAKRRLARSLPLNVMQHAARLEEAFEEQGRPSYIAPDRGVVVEDATAEAQPTAAELTVHEDGRPQWTGAQAQGPHPTLDLGPVTEQPTITDTLNEWDRKLTDAAKLGTAELTKVWADIPHMYRVNLKAALDRRHKPTARGVDAIQSPHAHSEP